MFLKRNVGEIKGKLVHFLPLNVLLYHHYGVKLKDSEGSLAITPSLLMSFSGNEVFPKKKMLTLTGLN